MCYADCWKSWVSAYAANLTELSQDYMAPAGTKHKQASYCDLACMTLEVPALTVSFCLIEP